MPRDVVRFSAIRDGLVAPSWKLTSQRDDEYVVASRLAGNYHITGHRDGRVHLAVYGTDRGTMREHVCVYDRSQPHPVVTIVATPASCVIPQSDHELVTTMLRHDEESAFFCVSYRPTGFPLGPTPQGHSVIGSVGLGTGTVWVTVKRDRLEPGTIVRDGVMLIPNTPSGWGVGAISMLTNGGILVLMGTTDGSTPATTR